MSSDSIIRDTAERLFAKIFPRGALFRASQGQWLAAEWNEMEAAGLTMALVGEEFGGFGLGSDEALSIVRLAGRFAVPLPLAETMLANFLLGRCGITPEPGAFMISTRLQSQALALEEDSDAFRVTGDIHAIGWAEHVCGIVALAVNASGDMFLARIDRSAFHVSETFTGIDQHPIASVRVDALVTGKDCARLPPGLDIDGILRLGAALRAVAMAGSMQQILEMTVTYASDRRQFGRPLSKFQVIQHQLAIIATQVAAAAACADMITESFSERLDPALVAVAKSRTGEASGIVASLAHQLHGAIGTTQEYQLHYFTNQLWQWRDEFGNETYWNETLARQALGDEAGLWPFIACIGADRR